MNQLWRTPKPSVLLRVSRTSSPKYTGMSGPGLVIVPLGYPQPPTEFPESVMFTGEIPVLGGKRSIVVALDAVAGGTEPEKDPIANEAPRSAPTTARTASRFRPPAITSLGLVALKRPRGGSRSSSNVGSRKIPRNESQSHRVGAPGTSKC